MNEQLAEIESDLIFKQQLNLAEHNIYVSSRLGVKQDTTQMHFSRFTASSIDTITGAIIKDSILYQSNGQVDSLNTQRVLAYKSYELSNHLGNVLAVVSDKRIYLGDTTISGDTFALWDAHITSAQDYYPFGMLMPNRHWVESDSSAYKYGFNGMERDDDWSRKGNSYDFGARIYDSRLGRFLSCDQKSIKFNNKSPYHFANNSPIITMDIDGNENIIYIFVASDYWLNGKCVSLTTVQQKEVFDKVVKVFEMLYQQNSQTSWNFDLTFAYTEIPLLANELDDSDIMAVASSPDYANEIYNDGEIHFQDLKNEVGSTSDKIWYPAFVNLGAQKLNHTSINYTDQVAYAIAHEIIHRITDLSLGASYKKPFDVVSGQTADDHDEGLLNIMDLGNYLLPMKDAPLEEWDNLIPSESLKKGNSYFRFNTHRIERMNKVFGKSTPNENASKKVIKRVRIENPIPKSKRKSFRKWLRNR